jgi:tRNA-dihydrouridine synthase A
MMDCTDRHDRYFLRLIAKDVLLYTEMITAQALFHNDADYLLKYDTSEHPLALQLGGNDPKLLAHAAKLGTDFGYDEINLNVGCPSSRVKSGAFGACLMLQPKLVAECVAAMRAVVAVPVTVKCRIGVDQQDDYAHLHAFISEVMQAGCQTFIIHARKAWLSGLSPKENREIPPLRYDVVHQVKKDFPQLTIILNGGLQTIAAIQEQLAYVDGVMIGRAAYANPYFLAEVQKTFFKQEITPSRSDIIQQLIPYISLQRQNNVKLSAISRHILGLFMGQRGAAVWRRYISQHAHMAEAGGEVIERALTLLQLAQE